MNKKLILENVLFIGPNYHNHRGGIGAVLSVYKNNITNFKFIPTYDSCFSRIDNFYLYIKSILSFISLLLKDRKIKIVHFHGASNGSFYRKYFLFLIARYIFRKKVIYHIHGGKYHIFYENAGISKKFIKHFIHGSDYIICLSQHWKIYFTNTFKIASIAIVNNPIEIPKYVSFEENKKELLSLLFLGKIGDNKGIFDLLFVLAKNKIKYKTKMILKIGGDGEIDRLQEYINSQGIQDLVKYEGWINGENKKSLLSECDALILPSYNEGLPISILEAMSYGKPIISTPVGGIPEVVINNSNGFLIEPGDIKSLERHLDWIVENIKELPKMGALSSIRVQEYYIDKVLVHLNKLYIEILSKK